MLVLQVVAAAPLHGYAIALRLRQISRDVVKVPQGTLYPALHRLENRKLLASEWKPSWNSRNAKFYRLTAKGRAHLKGGSDSWDRLAQALNGIQDGGQREPAGGAVSGSGGGNA